MLNNDTLGSPSTPHRTSTLTTWLLLSLLLHVLLMFMINRVNFQAAHRAATVILQELPAAPTAPVKPVAQSSLIEEMPLMVRMDHNQTLGNGSGVDKTATAFAPTPDQTVHEQPSDYTKQTDPAPPTQTTPEPSTPEPETVSLTSPTFIASDQEQKQEHAAPLPPPPTPKHNGPSLASLAQGYLNYMKSEHNQGEIDLEKPDLRYVSYCNAVAHYLSMSCAAYHGPLVLEHNLDTYTEIHIALDASGNVLNCSVSPSTGIDAADQALLTIIKRAAPFPPIPAHFNRKSFAFKTTIKVSLKRGNNDSLAMSWHG